MFHCYRNKQTKVSLLLLIATYKFKLVLSVLSKSCKGACMTCLQHVMYIYATAYENVRVL